MEKLSKFLVQAKVATYASDSGKKRILDDGGTELTYQEGDLLYRDRYYGSHTFLGEEVVFENGEKKWGMNYYGIILNDNISVDEFTDFLKKAMRQVSEERPFRGPAHFEEGNYTYKDKSDGDINHFSGIEKILIKGEEVYRLYYHGGLIKDF
ncbi:MAG: XRE family transcriptional regulator [Candidatus Colwellbacteria bacterium CG10_big_fil_rev_8_21_14_0_10_42_22]|uniref:XRE family transcriptional regulator n=1 Tax=Candidatus Colwellbacteria bacterium CG10_big_fil_rev_8_21_14_0_10_42_22 TaxID=1974540 RepID=A0A2H0VGP0_9BACT|nr:MAG: XRE family transcriptional regulator [Candidatus Colwellbacteria bacterium CG10_big_fil_rev_8_21_14_0_10_42_22]